MSDYDPSKDPRSSNALINAYLASKGLQPTGENVRRALEGNNANPGMIKGLVNSLPSTEAEDQAAMATRAGSRAGGGSNIPAPPVPPAGGGGGGDTSAAPGAPATDSSSWPLWQQILAGAATGLGFVGGSRLGNKKGAAAEPGVGETGLPDVRLSLNRPEIASSPAQIGNEAGTVRLGGTAAESNVAGLTQPRLLPSAASPQLSGPDAQFQVGGPETPKQLTAPNDARPVADPDVAIPGQRPAAPEVVALPGSRVQPIQSPDQFTAANPGANVTPQLTDNVPAIDTISPRAKGRTRAPRVRVTPRI
jgi:hypothetical protein